jgi:hypothetical protein
VNENGILQVTTRGTDPVLTATKPAQILFLSTHALHQDFVLLSQQTVADWQFFQSLNGEIGR